MNVQFNDIVQAVTGFIKLGYNHDYRIKDGQLHDVTVDRPIVANDIHVDASLRFESRAGSGDGSNIYAISERESVAKGLLIDAFDVLDKDCSGELFERLTSSRNTSYTHDEEVPMRYGLRKVFKDEYDAQSERFVLRIGFPDFPECSFGQSFSMLGFDTAEQQYVWLVTSILKDSRLNRIPYQAVDISADE
jgi:hypothetical protein